MDVVGVSGSKPVLQVGGRLFTDLTNMIVLNCAANSTKTSTARLPGGTSGYAVPAGKTLRILAMQLSGSIDYGCSVGYGDTDVGINSASVPTNYLNWVGHTSAPNASDKPFTPANGGVSCNWTVPTGKYPCSDSSTGAVGVVMYGYLE